MTVQLSFDSVNQHRLFSLLEWLREIGLVKSYLTGGEGQRTLEEEGKEPSYWLSKDKTGILAQMPVGMFESLLHQAKSLAILSGNTKDGKNQELLIHALAALLYDKEIFSAGQAADFSGLQKADFIMQLGKFQVSAFGETAEEISAL